MASHDPVPTLQEISLPPDSQLHQQPKDVTHNLELTTVATSHSRASLHFPDGGLRAWLVIVGSFSVICSTFGLISSVGLFQSYWQENQLANYSPGAVGWIAAVNIFLNLFLGVQIGPLFDRYGPRYLVLVGSVMYVVSLVVLAECTRYWHFMIVYGVVNGFSGACLTTTALAVVAHWFERRRGLASGIAFIGSSVGGIGFPLVLKSTLENWGWAWALRIVALIAAALLVVGNICVRGRLPPGRNGGTIDLRCFLDARFGWATAGIACFEFVLFGVLGLLPSYGLSRGFSSQATFNIIAILNAGSAFGRFFSGYLSDRWGRFNTMILTLLWSLIAILAFWLPVSNSLVMFYIFAPLFGFGSGSIISMAPVCLGQLCKADQYGQFYGTSYSIVSFATLLCIPVGGELLPSLSAKSFVGFFAGILVLSLASFMVARWACLDYRWRWVAKI